MILIDSYSESNYSNSLGMASGYITSIGQSFTGNGSVLDSVKFYLQGSSYPVPTGNATITIYAHSGTFGTSSLPTGSVLATSDNFDVSTLTTNNQLITFTFSGANKITLTNGVYYVVTINYSGGSWPDTNILVGYDSTTPTHTGNMSYYLGSWSLLESFDVCFYIYGDTTSSSPSSSQSASYSPSVSESSSESASKSPSSSSSSSQSSSQSLSASSSQSVSPSNSPSISASGSVSLSASSSSSKSPSVSPSKSPSSSQSASYSPSVSQSRSPSSSVSASPSVSPSKSPSSSVSSSVSKSPSLSQSASYSPSVSPSASPSASPSPSIAIPPPEKSYLIKVYNSDGRYITTWNDATFSPFTKSINGGLGECTIQLARPFDDFGEGSDIKFANEVQIWVSDKDTVPVGVKVYSGYISSYEPFVDGGSEGVSIKCLGYVTHLKRYLVKGAATVIYAVNDDTSDVVKHLVDNYRAFYNYAVTPKAGFHRVNYSTASIPALSGNTFAYSFSNISTADAIEKTRAFAPANWWWYLDSDNLLNFKSKPIHATHRFILGKDFKSIRVRKNIENFTNQAIFWNGLESTDADYLRSTYNDAASQNEYMLFYEILNDGRVTVQATANLYGNSKLAEKSDPEIKTEITIVDNNEGTGGYDIESINPGDTCTLVGFNPITSQTFDANMTISEVNYSLDAVVLTLSNKQEEVGRQIANMQTQLDELSNLNSKV